MVAGPPPENKLFSVLIGWRGYEEASVADIKKFYNTVNATPFDSQLKRVWFSPTEDGELQVYLTRKINFGEVAAGAVAGAALRLTAEIFCGRSDGEVREMYSSSVTGGEVQPCPEAWRPSSTADGEKKTKFELPQPSAAVKIARCTYVDDFLGGSNKGKARALINEVEGIIKNGTFSFKTAVYSGDKVEPTKVLGLIWDSAKDRLYVPARVNESAKFKGRRTSPDLDLANLKLELAEEVTKRIVFRITGQLYDPLGLLGPISLKIKLVLREACARGLSWDDTLLADLRQDLIQSLEDRQEMERANFPRSIVADGATGLPHLIMFSDGSSLAYAAFAYLRWPTYFGYKSVLVATKNRVAPLKTESIPRMEILGCLLSVRLAKSIKESLPFGLEGEMYLTDSTCAAAQIAGSAARLNVFNSHRVGEIQALSAVKSWRWIPGKENISDIATRPDATVQQLLPGCQDCCQDGPAWMKKDIEDWPGKSVTVMEAEVPASELNPKLVVIQASCNKVLQVPRQD